MSQVGIESLNPRTLDGLAYSHSGRNLKTGSVYGDFIGPYNWTVNGGDGFLSTNNGGAGASCDLVNGTSARPGRIGVHCGTTNTGYGAIRTDGWALEGSAAAQYVFECELSISVLSTAIEEFYVNIGFGDQVNPDMNDGAYFQYDRTTNVNWLACVAAGGVVAKVDTGILIDTGYYKLKVFISGPTAYFYINGVLVATVAAGVPGPGNYFGVFCDIVKTVGVTDRYFYMDWYWFWYDLVAPR